MEKFAGYGFNRSHSAAYGLLTYQTAFLKRYYPVEFFAALLTCDKDDTDAVVKFIAEAKSDGIAVLRPDVNESETDFSVVAGALEGVASSPTKESTKAAKESAKAADEQSSSSSPTSSPTRSTGDRKVIRFGLGAVKGVGEGAVEVIEQARAQGGALLSLFDFCRRVDGRKVNRKVIEALVKAGAFDGVAQQNGVTRARVFGAIGLASERAAEAQRDRESGQTNLLALLTGGGGAKSPGAATGDDRYPPFDEWMPKELLAYEKEALGFYISGHPLDRYASEIRRFTNATAANCTEKGERAEVILARRRRRLSGAADEERRTASTPSSRSRITAGQIEYIVNSKKVDDYREILSKDEPLLVTGTVDTPFGEGETARERLRFLDAKPLARVRAEKSSLLDIKLNADLVSEDQLRALEKVLRMHTGACRAVLRMEIPMRSESILPLGDDYKIAASDDLLARIEQIFGDRVAVLR